MTKEQQSFRRVEFIAMVERLIRQGIIDEYIINGNYFACSWTLGYRCFSYRGNPNWSEEVDILRDVIKSRIIVEKENARLGF